MRPRFRILGIVVIVAIVCIGVGLIVWSLPPSSDQPKKVETIHPDTPSVKEVALYELQLRDATWIEIAKKDGEQIRQIIDNAMLPWGYDTPPGVIADPVPTNLPFRMTTINGKQFLYYLNRNGLLVDPGDRWLLLIPDNEQKILAQVLSRISP